MHSQDPQMNPEFFTPVVDPLKFKWPTDQEAKEWAEDVFHENICELFVSLHRASLALDRHCWYQVLAVLLTWQSLFKPPSAPI